MNTLITIILVLTFTILVRSQDPILEGLDDPNPLVRQRTLALIEEDLLYQYIPALETRIFNQPAPFLEWEYLLLLEHLNSPNLETIAVQFIEVADTFETQFPYKDPLESKVLATRILILLENYTTIDLIFEIIERDKPDVNQDAFSSLIEMLNNIPAYEEYAKQELLYIASNNNNDFDGYYALHVLRLKYGSELMSDYINYFENSPHLTVRMLALDLLHKKNYVNLQSLLIERLPLEPDWSFRGSIFALILEKFGEPSDLIAVINYQPNEPNATTRTLMAYSIDNFIPPRPTVSTSVMIDNLISYTHELYLYGWITQTPVYQQYLSYLADIEEAYDRQKVNALCINLNDLLDYTEGLHISLLTEEGYKFMHYHGTYIKENVEAEFGPCE